MKLLYPLISLLISNFCCNYAYSISCEQHFQSEYITLSDGSELTIPSISSDFNLLSVIGFVDLGRLSKTLALNGLYPLKVNNRGVVLVSFYDYKKSNMGVFREFYIVTLATRKASSGLKSIWQVLNSIRNGPNSPSENILFHHLMAVSNSDFGRLASSEVWGIPSFAGVIDLSLKQKISAQAHSLDLSNLGEINIEIQNNLIFNPLGLNFHVYASGINEGSLVRSPVIGCGPTFGSSWSKNDLINTTGVINNLLSYLKFAPFRKEVGEHLKAVQFGPEGKL